MASPSDVLGLSPAPPQTAEALKDEAIRSAERLARELPERPEAHSVLALAYFRFRRTADAAKAWEKALEFNPQFSPAYFGLGTVAADRAEHERAATLLRKAIELDPQLEGARSRLIEVLLQQGQAEEALGVARASVRRFPESRESHYWLGQTELQLQHFAEARRAHVEAVRLAPELTPSYYSLTIACARLGLIEEARKYQRQLATLKQSDQADRRGRHREYSDLPAQRQVAAEVHLAAGNVHLRFGDPRKAEAHWRRGAAVNPLSAACRESLLTLFSQQDRPLAALEVAEELARLEPNKAEPRLRLGRLLARVGRGDEAEGSLRQALELAPDNAEICAGLVRLHLEAARPLADALELAEKAAALAPSAETWLLLSAVREEAGDRAGALTALRKALQHEPNHPQLRQAYERLHGNTP